MKKGIKLGFGLTVGYVLAAATISMITKGLCKWAAKDEDFMKWEKDHNPKMYEKLKEYV